MTSEGKKTALSVFYIVLLVAVFMAFIFGWQTFVSPPLGEDFSLTDSNGKTVTQVELREKPSAIFFGYTMCPDICPTTLMSMTNWIKELGPDADKINIWFITVDPERDTPEVLHDYLSNFTDKVVGISGDPAKVHELVSSFNIAAEKVPGENGDYTYDHTAAILLTKKGGQFAGVIPYSVEENRNELKDQIAIERLKSLAKQ
ncbi:SCO family protein [Bartonella sp. W8098]|uniref:SCO family protein n=1 Tax=Bartonella TaxID=773 RepID=UPI000969C142|nr:MULTISPECIES: SCO family protein [Bartonella]MBH9987342.1 SCO family protein [Bartonella apis]MBI0171649.1 SCO family protein [Bartonella sp. W8151]OLY46088.1 protein SCO1/2 [Bartonella apis]